MSGSPTRPSAVPPLRIPQPLFLSNARSGSERLMLSLQFLHEDTGLNLKNTLEVLAPLNYNNIRVALQYAPPIFIQLTLVSPA
jgi:hypothetical protein